MAKHQRKIQAALTRRLDAWRNPHPVNGMATHKPGSQNKKKTGYGSGSGAR